MNKFTSTAIVVGCLAVSVLAQGTPNVNVDRAHHVLRRITFGPNQALVTQLSAGQTAVDSYILAQLNPPAPSAPNFHGSQAVADLLNGNHVPNPLWPMVFPASLGGVFPEDVIARAQIAYALESEWQLREIMTQFWERHFSTNISQSLFFTNQSAPGDANDVGRWFEWEANQWYRANCLTTFHDLLRFTSRHASMMVYLHMPQNDGSNPNEDYARELLELYTMSPEHRTASGVVSNYVQDDVEKVARILTGWDVDNQANFVFQFDDPDHDYPLPNTETKLFTTTSASVAIFPQISPNGEQEGLDLLLELAKHPATKTFICRKLIAYFVDENIAAQPNPPVLQSMRAAWGSLGNISAVLGAMFNSSEFQDPNNRLQRLRIPMESVVASARAVEGRIRQHDSGDVDPSCLQNLFIRMFGMGQRLHMYPAPNGFPTSNQSQFSPSQGLSRSYHAWNLIGDQGLSMPDVNVVTFLAPVVPALPPMPDMVNIAPHLFASIDFMLSRFYGSNYTNLDEFRLASAMIGVINFVNMSPIGPFDPANSQHYDFMMRAAAAAGLGMVQIAER